MPFTEEWWGVTPAELLIPPISPSGPSVAIATFMVLSPIACLIIMSLCCVHYKGANGIRLQSFMSFGNFPWPHSGVLGLVNERFSSASQG